MYSVGNLEQLSDKCFGDLLSLIHSLTGITIASNRKSMVQGRIRKRAMQLALNDYESYLELVKSDLNEKNIFIDLITTNETYFFRTPRIWDYIEKVFLPNWYKDHPKKIFMVWSAAASSGEEAHSLGILCQSFKEKHPGFSYQILGTDISQEMVQLCQKGLYCGKSIESFKKARPDMFMKYMIKAEDSFYQVNADIKSRLKFQTHNLFKSQIFADAFDLILLRNVLIYFTAQDQEVVLAKIAPRLSEAGVLIIGESESLSHIQHEFKHIEPLVYGRICSVGQLQGVG